MKIENFVTLLPNALLSTISKSVRLKLDEACKQEILEKGLYHITKDEDTANKIIESQHLRPSTTAIVKNIGSYGTAAVHLFNGCPTVNDYIKNLTNAESTNSDNPFTNPRMVVNAVSIKPTEMEELDNYKLRLQDNVILYEGYCILPSQKSKAVYLVPDLVRDAKTKQPIINEKTGRYDVAFREADENELSEDKKSYNAEKDYLDYIQVLGKELGYSYNQNFAGNIMNRVNRISQAGNIEGQMTKENVTFGRIFNLIKQKINSFFTPKLDMSTDEKINSAINSYNHDKKNPYRYKQFGQEVANIQKQGLEQVPLKQELEKLTTSQTGKFFREKMLKINEVQSKGSFIHGKSHSDRVAMLTMLIANKENLFENDFDDKTKDILITAACYHDIGRIVDVGPHGRKGTKKLKKMDLRYLNGDKYSLRDRRIVQAIVEAHEGKDKDMEKVCKRYKIEKEDIQYTKNLMSIVKDADALDRVRLHVSALDPVGLGLDLNPKYLRTDSAKQLINASYQLESLYSKVPFDRILSYKTDKQTQIPKSNFETKKEKFNESLKVEIKNISNVINRQRKKLKLNKDYKAVSLKGAFIDKFRQASKKKDQVENEEKEI